MLARLGIVAIGLLSLVTLGCGNGTPPVAPGNAQVEGDPTAANGNSEPTDPKLAGTGTSSTVALRTSALPESEWSDGWLSLFDGQTLFGWERASEADWRVEDGAIVVESGTKGLLVTTTRFDQYQLRVEFKSAVGTNSGIFLNSPKSPNDPGVDCYELNIADQDNPFPTASLVKRKKVEGTFDSEDWQAYDVTVADGRVQVTLDGERVLDYQDADPPGRRHIGLQLNEGRVAFRNIKIKPLKLKPLLNGKDLAGWTEYPKMKSRFQIAEDGTLNVKDGRGQLETEQRFGDFVLQLQCISHAPRLNSGIFFRCIPGDQMMGYEAQIHNGFGDSRAEPEDWGTGAIFRFQKARLVVADDQQWFGMTLIADGPHMASWVNGMQVVDWIDERPANENPRRGLRVEPGTLMIQGHDPTTDLSFRQLFARELMPAMP